MYHFMDHPDTYAIPDLQALAKALETPFLVGAEYVRVRQGKAHELYNAAMVVDASGALSPVWSAKIYLVPFVEATPFTAAETYHQDDLQKNPNGYTCHYMRE